MNARMIAWTLTLSLASVAPLVLNAPHDGTPLDRSELSALRAADDGSLDELRAGLLQTPASIEAAERAAMQSAAATDESLEQLRAGDIHLTDREIKLMLIAAGVIIVIALLI